MVNVGPLAAEILSLVWGTPGNFNGFRVLAALQHGTLVVGVSQTAALNRGRHLYSAGRPSRWAFAHISSSCYFWISISKLPWTAWRHATEPRPPWTRGARTQLEFTARDYEFTSSRGQWNAGSPLVNSWSRLHEFNGTQQYFRTRCGLNTNLRCRSETCCTCCLTSFFRLSIPALVAKI